MRAGVLSDNSLVSPQTFRKGCTQQTFYYLCLLEFQNINLKSLYCSFQANLTELSPVGILARRVSPDRYHTLLGFFPFLPSFLVFHDTFPASIWPGVPRVVALDLWSVHCLFAAWPSSYPMALTTTHLLKTLSPAESCLHPRPVSTRTAPAPKTSKLTKCKIKFVILTTPNPHACSSFCLLQPAQWHQGQFKMPIQGSR